MGTNQCVDFRKFIKDVQSISAVSAFKDLQRFWNYQPASARTVLSVLTKFRNVCAHGERLFTYRTIDNISDLPLHQNLSIPKNGIQYLYGKNDLFAAVIAFRYLLPKEDFYSFKRKLTVAIGKSSKKLIHITEAELLEHMGFPANWKDISRCQITP